MAEDRDLDDSPLVGTDWLERHLDDPGVRVVDVRWRSRLENGRGVSYDDAAGYREGHIPGAVFGRMVADLSDPDHPVSDMLAPPAQFAAAMGRLGIGDDTLVVAYDDHGLPQGAARLWWALRRYGHRRARVLDGGLRQWRREGRAVTAQVPAVAPAVFTPRPEPGWVADKAAVTAALGDGATLLIDCLSPEQFAGTQPTGSMWGRRPGHIPGAVNVPAFANLDPRLGAATYAEREALLGALPAFTLAERAALARLYRAAGVTPGRPVITYCGRGFAAAAGLLALHAIGHTDARLYDGSLAEWTADSQAPMETGAQPARPST